MTLQMQEQSSAKSYYKNKWEDSLVLYNDIHMTSYTYDYVMANFKELQAIKDSTAYRNPNDTLSDDTTHMCMCSTIITNCYIIYDKNDMDHVFVVGCECIKKIDENREVKFMQKCRECPMKYPFKAGSTSKGLCKGCYKDYKLKEKIKEEQKQDALRQEMLKNAWQKCKCGNSYKLGNGIIPYKQCFSCNQKSKEELIKCHCGFSSYKKPFTQCYKCNAKTKTKIEYIFNDDEE